MLAFEPNRSWFRSTHVLTDCEDRAMTMRRRAMWLLKVHKSHSDMARSQTRNRVNQFTLSFHSFLRLLRRNAHTFESLQYCGKYTLTAQLIKPVLNFSMHSHIISANIGDCLT